MRCRVYVENPPPFKAMARGDGQMLVDVPIEEGVETIRLYLAAGLRLAGFHHSDLDRYEARHTRGRMPPERYDSFEYARLANQRLGGFSGLLVPHRVIVYHQAEAQEHRFRQLAEAGIRDVVLVGKPFTNPPDDIAYRNTVEEMLAYLRERMPTQGLMLGAIGIHTRPAEPERIARKYQAAGRQLRVMGQFLDDAAPMLSFMEALVREFEARRLDLSGLEWNVGLAIFALKNRTFYAQLLRKVELACERRLHGADSVEARLAESVEMDLEFAAQVKERGNQLGLDIGFSIQPLIERTPSGAIHPGVHGATLLAERLAEL